MKNKLYEFTIKVSRGEGCDLPDGMTGAQALCYASAPDHEASLKKGAIAVAHNNFVFENVESKVREISLTSWAEYIDKVWPEFADHFPSQTELPDLVNKGVVFFGPFAGF